MHVANGPCGGRLVWRYVSIVDYPKMIWEFVVSKSSVGSVSKSRLPKVNHSCLVTCIDQLHGNQMGHCST
jgi:hypothetical protein